MFSSSPSPSIVGGLSLPTSTLEPVSSSTPSIWGRRSFLHIRREEGSSPSSFPAAWERRDAVPVPSSLLSQVQASFSVSSLETSVSASSLETSQATTTSQHEPSNTQDAEETLATQVTVGSQPDICKTSSLTWRKEMQVTHGVVRFRPDERNEADGWGEAGSIWNFTIGGGARLVRMKAQCQGRICSVNATDDDRPAVESGIMEQRPDGSWFLRVTDRMQRLMVSGEVVADTAGDSNQTYPLEVASKLTCWLPVAKNCTQESFYNNLTQWYAYNMPRFLTNILQDGPTSYYDFGDMLMKKGLPAQDAIAQECSIDQVSNCRRPAASDCEHHSDADHIRFRMGIDAYITLIELIWIMHASVGEAGDEMGTSLESLVTHMWKPAAEQVWDKPKKAAVASNVVGLVIGAAVALQVVLAILIPFAAPEVLAVGAAVDTAIVEGAGTGAAVAAGAAGRVGAQAAAEAGEIEAAGAGAGAAGAAGRTGQAAEGEAVAAGEGEAAAAAEGNAAAAGEGEAAAASEGQTAAGEASKGTAQRIKDAAKKHANNFVGLIVAASIFGSNSAGLHANLDTMKSDPEAPDTQMRAALHYKLEAEKMVNQTQANLREALESKDTGPDAIQKMFEGGQWITEELRANITKDHLGPKIKDWYKGELFDHFVNELLFENNIYGIFIEYDPSGESYWVQEKVPFTQEVCEKDWVGNPKWKFAATCDIPYQPDGPLGMAVLVRTPVAGKGLETTETKQLFETPMEFQGHQIDAPTVIESMMHGQALGGIGYSLGNKDPTKGMEDKGLEEMTAEILNTDPRRPGRFVAAFCLAVTNLVYAPGSWEGMWNYRKRSNPESRPADVPYGGKYASYAKIPCPCRNWWYQAAGGEKRFFRDYVRSNLTDAMDNDCAHGTGFHGGTYKDDIDIPN